MLTAGYVLAGGTSRRMGRDKSLLAFRGGTLIEYVAAAAEEAAGSATIVGPSDRYHALGRRIIPDLRHDCGPLAGIESALRDSSANWTLILACDLPRLDPASLNGMLEFAAPGVDVVLPETPDGRIHPLCGWYGKRVAFAATAALDGGVRKVLEGLSGLFIQKLPVPEMPNANTPEDWAAYSRPS